MKTHIYFIRHGQSEGNLKDLYLGHMDLDLSELGYRQAEKAIEYFKAEGGYFTFITGRMPFYVSYAVENVKPNVPIGCVNGGGVYDFQKNEKPIFDVQQR